MKVQIPGELLSSNLFHLPPLPIEAYDDESNGESETDTSIHETWEYGDFHIPTQTCSASSFLTKQTCYNAPSTFHPGLASVRQTQPSQKSKKKSLGLTQDNRATTEQVLDPRTISILQKLQKRCIFDSIHGTISTGKEANVYLAFSQSHALAVKIFKTSILIFKDRSKYVEGDYRFQNGYSGRGNPRKIVELWAEKEFRNLRRCQVSGIFCPIPCMLRQHVIVMTCLTRSEKTESSQNISSCTSVKQEPLPPPNHNSLSQPGITWAAPRMKNVILSLVDWLRLYVEVLTSIRILYHKCRLIHGDLSEYNILVHDGHAYIIDVAQSVEHDHPSSINFLKNDCLVIYKFFKRIFQDGYHVSEDDDCETSFCQTTEQEEERHDVCNYNVGNSIVFDVDGIFESDVDVSCKYKISNQFVLLTPKQMYELAITPDSLSTTVEPVVNWWKDNEIVKNSLHFTPADECRYLGANLDPDDLFLARAEFFKMCHSILQFIRFETQCTLNPTQFDERVAGVSETTFLSTWAPTSLSEIADFRILESELEKHSKGNDTIFDNLVQKNANTCTKINSADHIAALDSDSDTSESDACSDGESNASLNSAPQDKNGSSPKAVFTGHIPESVSRKEWKKLVKEQARLRREHKIPKALKKKHSRAGSKR